MTIRYVGIGGSDGANGLTWATRKATLNGVEDTPVVAGDTVYVGPGTYRQQLTMDVNGSSGNPITYIADVTGAYTDGIGGLVRITTIDNDATGANVRTSCISGQYRSYRTFRGFYLDGSSPFGFFIDHNQIVIEDCVLGWGREDSNDAMYFSSNADNRVFTVKRCIFNVGNYISLGYAGYGSAYIAPDSYIENCVFVGSFIDQGFGMVNIAGGGQITMRNCTFINGRSATHGPVSDPIQYAYNCLLHQMETGFYYLNANVVDDYNGASPNIQAISDSPGTNDQEHIIIFKHPMPGYGDTVEPYSHFELSPENTSYLAETDDGNAPSEDLFGLQRSSVNGKRSWGAIQHQNIYKETTITRNSSAAALGISDFGCKQFIIPVMETKLTVSVYVYREADYTGTLPQLIIKRPGQADITITDTGSTATWNLLTTSFVHNGLPQWLCVELRSNNTATSGNYKVVFEDLVLQ
jgi:hypothetical protein